MLFMRILNRAAVHEASTDFKFAIFFHLHKLKTEKKNW